MQIAGVPDTMPQLPTATTTDGLTAAIVILAMGPGLIVANVVIDGWAKQN